MIIRKNKFVNCLLLLPLFVIMGGCNDDEKEQTVLVDFSLQNIDGKESNEFKQGDDLLFVLTINNKSDQDICYKVDGTEGDLVFDNDLFMVYNKEGTKINKPWSGLFCYYILYPDGVGLKVPKHSIRQFCCSWYFNSSMEESFPFCYNYEKSNSNLEKGEYYTEFQVRYNIIPGDNSTKSQKSFYVPFKIK